MAQTEVIRPRLRPLELKWLQDGEQPILFMRDPTGVAPFPATVPAWVALLLGFCDGERDVAGIRAAFELRTGDPVTHDDVQRVIDQLDEALFLDSPRFQQARLRLIEDYRGAAFRPAALADRVYPGTPTDLERALASYATPADADGAKATAEIRGVVSPHIDYQRGGRIYARTWRRAAEAVQAADLVVVFGTDHAGGPGKITLTQQNYATPFGVLPTATDVVDAIAEAIGSEGAFEEELHHKNEHSVELATVWLHSIRLGAPPAVVPILCGSFHRFTEGEVDPAIDDAFGRTIQALAQATAGRRVLAVAAADLAHVGPAFGDPAPLSQSQKDDVAAKDRQLLDAICAGNPGAFFELLRAERDCRRICGLPPIYLMLRYLGACRGEVVGYDQCPADATGGSLVSIAGVLLT
jgi:MEMO1 family protein